MRFIKVNPNKELFLGHQYDNGEKRAIEKRCDYCGRWFCFDVKDWESWGDNIKFAFNGIPEKIHCGNSLCQDYHHKVLIYQNREDEKWRKRGDKLFIDLKQAGVKV
jgi:hypothetical protein